ncbi:MAG: DUF362 domain-containing protein [Candidatus Margulisiibacteriota bacterium]
MSKVFFTKDTSQVDKLFDQAGLGKIIAKDDFVALKIHFGERGNHAFLKPERVKDLVKKVKKLKGRPFWTDANTLYRGGRMNTLDHLQTAFDHGYTIGKTGAHVLIADGLDGKTHKEIAVNHKHFKKLFVAPLILDAQALIAVSHFKGHEVTGFGGAIKNIGMGLGSRLGKLKMHQECKGCPEIKTCRRNISLEACWVGSPDLVQEKMAEYAAGVAGKFKDKAAYINFITDVSENCDCLDSNSEPIVPDIGILASSDPVAIDQASIDLVNKTEGRIQADDKFKKLWPKVNWETQLSYGEEIGLGSRKYELVTI